jgi:hypothetical protein
MDWIKRNLLFVVGGVVALVLMGLAGFYLYTGMGKNDAALEKLNAEYATLSGLNSQNPHPGDDKIDNIKAAKEQDKAVRAFVTDKAAMVFKPIPPIPDSTNADNSMLAGALRKTIDQMRKDAVGRGVQVATNYYFSFTAERDRIMFDKAGLIPLSVQLGEVKAICDVLFAARVNALDGIRREKVSVHDVESQMSSDYLSRSTVTNEIALISPYEVSVRCFSSEIAGMLSGFAASPNGLIVRAINVEPAVLGLDPGAAGGAMPTYAPQPVYQPAPTVRRLLGEEGEFRPVAPVAPPPVYVPATPAGKGGLPTLLDEKQLKVTLLIEVVKLTPTKK